MCLHQPLSLSLSLSLSICKHALDPDQTRMVFRQFKNVCCVVVTMEVEVTSLQGMMGILRNSCIRKKDGGEVSYSGCDAKNRNDSY